MIAWVSPCFTVRSTPRRISFVTPSLPVTDTCRLRMSRVAKALLLHGDIDVVAVDLHRVDRDGAGRRQPGRAAAAQVEPRPVQPALDRAVADVTLRQRDLGVRALVVDREDLALGLRDAHRDTV